jgi:Winged helix-turn helix
MRYPDGNELTVQGGPAGSRSGLRQRRCSRQDADARQIARPLRVSTKSVYQWQRSWRAGGAAALASKGRGGSASKLDEEQQIRLNRALDAGLAIRGWDSGQRWTLARVAALITRGNRLNHPPPGRISINLRGNPADKVCIPMTCK